MRNFKQEILAELHSNEYDVKDIDYINTLVDGFRSTNESNNSSFKKCTDIEEWLDSCDFEYNNSFGGEEINVDLKIVMKDGSWFERNNYDGDEWFEHKIKPEREEG